jgi:N-acetylglutamate synthase-like GNAT family acetyltransferase
VAELWLAEPEDAFAIAALVNGAEGDRIDAAKVLDLLSAPHSTFLLCIHGRELVGCVHLAAVGTTAVLGMLAVRPAQQDQGIDTQLLERGERLAREEWGCVETKRVR